MPEKKGAKKESPSFIKEVEKKIEESFAKKKEEIDKELNEKIKLAKQEAKKEVSRIEKKIEEEKSTLSDYWNVIDEFESKKADLEGQVKDRFSKAIGFQKEIDRLTEITLNELREVSMISHELEELHKEAKEKAGIIKKDLEDKFGVVTEILKEYERVDIVGDLEKELEKLKKIKELLGKPESAEREVKEEKAEEEAEDKAPSSDEEVEDVSQYGVKDISEAMESLISDIEEKQEVDDREGEEDSQDEFATLREYRKTESSEESGEIRYFQKDDKIILDGESIVSALNRSIEEAKKLYLKLAQTDTLKDQYYVKQEIVNQQKALLKFVLKNIEMCKEESCSLPIYTIEILNSEVIKDILEKLSMQNWGNQAEFDSFVEYLEDIKNNYYTRITPPSDYLDSIIRELGIESQEG